MPDTATLTVMLPAETASRLAALAERDASTEGEVVARAVLDFLDRDAEIVAAIERGQADLRAGRVFTQAEVMRDVQAIIATARVGR